MGTASQWSKLTIAIDLMFFGRALRGEKPRLPGAIVVSGLFPKPVLRNEYHRRSLHTWRMRLTLAMKVAPPSGRECPRPVSARPTASMETDRFRTTWVPSPRE